MYVHMCKYVVVIVYMPAALSIYRYDPRNNSATESAAAAAADTLLLRWRRCSHERRNEFE